MNIEKKERKGAFKLWRAMIPGGFILGLAGSLSLVLFYITGDLFSQLRPVLWIPLLLAANYYIIKKYRDTHRSREITYGAAVGAGAVASLYYGICMAFTVLILYGVVDTGLADIQLAAEESDLINSGLSEQQVEERLAARAERLKPHLIAAGQMVQSFAGSLFCSLITALLLSRVKERDH